MNLKIKNGLFIASYLLSLLLFFAMTIVVPLKMDFYPDAGLSYLGTMVFSVVCAIIWDSCSWSVKNLVADSMISVWFIGGPIMLCVHWLIQNPSSEFFRIVMICIAVPLAILRTIFQKTIEWEL